MKALTLHQPWATMVALGSKPYETRSWPPPAKLIGQRIAIHAGKSLKGFMPSVPGMRLRWVPKELRRYLPRDHRYAGQFVLGAVVCTARLVAAHLVHDRWERDGEYVMASAGRASMASHLDPSISDDILRRFRIDASGDFSPGRWAWRLLDIEKLPEPVPATGQQGLWEWTP